MKKIIIAALCLLTAAGASAQRLETKKETMDTVSLQQIPVARKDSITEAVIPHLKFKGVPITGPVERFKGALAEKGMRNYAKATNSANGTKDEYVRGSFSGKDVIVHITYTPISRTVFGAFVYLPADDIWEDAYEDYSLFKKHLMAVYGEPAKSTEKFIEPYRRGDGYSIKALNEDKCKFHTVWHTFEGLISVEILPAGNNAQVLISYVDSLGSDINENENTKLIENDL